jgi:hypothetical protein
MSNLQIEELEEFRDIRDKFESNYTVIVNNMLVGEIQNVLTKKLETINTLKDNFKKKYLNNRFYSLVNFFNQKDPTLKNSGIYLVGQELQIIDLKKSWSKTLNEWGVSKLLIRNDEYFPIDYINSLLLDNSFYDVVEINNKNVTYKHLNKTKKKIIKSFEVGKDFSLIEYILEKCKNEENCLIHGISSIIKSFKNDNVLAFNKRLRDEEIFDEFNNKNMGKIHNELREIMGHLSNEKMTHRVKIGKDIQKAMKYVQLQTLYCTEQFAKKVRENVPIDLQHFTIITVTQLEKGDIVTTLQNDYGGALGYTYY